MKHSTTLFAILLIFVISLSLDAQPERFYTSDKEISSSLINQIYQDSKGFVWIATEDGLNRFDGNKFTIYRHENKDPLSLKINYVQTVLEDHMNRFWIGSSSGLLRYNRASDNFTEFNLYKNKKRITPYIQSIIESRDKNIWVATSGQGLITISPDNKSFLRQDISNIIHTDYINCLYEDHNGCIWIGTENRGLFKYDSRAKRIIYHKIFNDFTDNNITSINEDRKGNLLVSSFSGSLFRLDAATGTFIPVNYIGKFLNIKTLERPADKNIFICTDGQGIKKYNEQKQCIENYPIYNTIYDLEHSKVHSLIFDRDHNLWLGIFEKGTIMIPTQKNKFDYIGCKSPQKNTIGTGCVMSIYKDSYQHITWIGTDNDGLYGIDDNGKQVKHFSQENITSFPNTLICIFKDSHHNLWGGSFFNGLANINTNSGSCNYLPLLKNNTVYCLNEDKNNNLWIGTYRNGIYLYNLNNHKIQHYYTTHDEPAPTENQLCNNWINALLMDHKGNIWIGTCSGLSCYDSKRKSFISLYRTNNLLPKRTIYCLHEDSESNIWVGTTDGIYIITPRKHAIKHFTTQNGLPNNVICGIQAGNGKTLWISTHNGLSKFDPRDNSFTNYFDGDGIQGNEFTRGASFNCEDGKLFFGGIYGITTFYSGQITNQNSVMHLMITNFYIANHAVRMGDKSGSRNIINTSIYDAKEFNLAHRDNTFSIELSAMNFSNPNRITYQYKLDDNSEWISMRPGINQVTFSELKPGKHNFIARAIDHDVASFPVKVDIIIRPEWYQTGEAYLLYLFILFCIGYFSFNYAQMQIRNKRKYLQIQEAERINESKLQFFINISHDIRTPMTLIINPIEKLLKTNKYPELKDTYEMIFRNSQQILRLINQIMDLRKLDKGQLHLTFRKIDLVTYINELMHNFTYLAKSKQITMQLLHNEETITAWIDKNNFDKIILNIVGNAFKYTPEGGTITINLSTGENKNAHHPLDKYIEISISDTGIGIDPNKINRIFERFYQINNPNASSNYGTGIGLNLAMKLVHLHHGTINAYNNSTNGCSFSICIPLGCDHLEPEEIAIDNEEHSIENANILLNGTTISSKAKPKTNSRILVIDDEDEMRKFIHDELCETYSIETCRDGKEALNKLLTEHYDLVISDVMMPVMDGIELCKKIKQNININYIPVILLTAKTGIEDKMTGLETGADAYIPKPFSTDYLQKSIENLLENRKRISSRFENREKIDEKISEIQIKSNDDTLMEKIIKVINENISNPELNVEMLAQEVGLSRVHLYRKLKELTNLSARDFIRSIRLKQAAKLLISKKINISEVAYTTGFSNLSHFSDSFKDFFGESPKEYIEHHVENHP